MKASKARLLSEAEARRKDKPQELAAKKMQAVTGETRKKNDDRSFCGLDKAIPV